MRKGGKEKGRVEEEVERGEGRNEKGKEEIITHSPHQRTPFPLISHALTEIVRNSPTKYPTECISHKQFPMIPGIGGGGA